MKKTNYTFKIIFFILSLIILSFPASYIEASAAEESSTESSSIKYNNSLPEISYSVSGSTSVGSTITISVNTNSTSSIYGASLDFLFNKDVIDITKIDLGNVFSNTGAKPIINKIEDNKASIAVSLNKYNRNISASSGSLFTITAKVLNAGSINLKTTDLFNSLSLNGNTSCVKLSSNYGSKINYTSIDKTFNTLDVLPLTAGTY